MGLKNWRDPNLKVNNYTLQKRLIYWRLGVFGFKSICIPCNEKWSKAHLVKCKTIQKLLKSLFLMKTSRYLKKRNKN